MKPRFSGPRVLAACAAVAFWCVPHLVGAAPLTPKSPLWRQIAGIYDQQVAAIVARNVPLLFAHFAPGYTTVDRDGAAQTLQEQRRVLGALLAVTHHAVAGAVVQSVETVDGGAIVLVREHMDLDLVNPSTGQRARFTDVETDKDYWARKHDVWLLQRSKTLSQSEHIAPTGPSRNPAAT